MSEKTITIQLPAGSSVVFTVPINTEDGKGFFPRKDPVRLLGETRNLVRGFVSENPSTGAVAIEGTDSLSVKYSHTEPAENKIHFYALTGEKTTIYIINTPIHDHSSVVQGGPAFGTYYVDETNE